MQAALSARSISTVSQPRLSGALRWANCRSDSAAYLDTLHSTALALQRTTPAKFRPSCELSRSLPHTGQRQRPQESHSLSKSWLMLHLGFPSQALHVHQHHHRRGHPAARFNDRAAGHLLRGSDRALVRRQRRRPAALRHCRLRRPRGNRVLHAHHHRAVRVRSPGSVSCVLPTGSSIKI